LFWSFKERDFVMNDVAGRAASGTSSAL
jgi:hypothetical protein